MHETTRIVRATLTPPRPGAPLHTGPVFAAPFHVAGDPADVPYSYGRSHNPTWTALEQAVAALETPDTPKPPEAKALGKSSVKSPTYSSVRALVYSSGLAAIAAVFGTFLRPGDAVVLASNAYFAARSLLHEHFVPFGIELRLASGAGDLANHLAGARLLWIESPSNPTLEIADLRALSASARAAGALVAVDNTTLTPLLQQPLALGADLSVCSGSKALTGHSDLLLGTIATRDQPLFEQLDRHRTLHGPALGPMEAWLALRSLATLPLRLERASANALALACFLSNYPGVEAVLYPGLPSHPGHAIAADQLRRLGSGFGPVLSFTLPSRRAAETFLSSAELITEATSFGGITTTAERRARWGHDSIAEGFIRLSAGCEHIDDLEADLAQALTKAL